MTIAGFSQGAGVAIDMAVEEPRIGALASFSPCLSMLRGELPKRRDLRILLAHGSADAVCPVEESRSLARVLEAAHKRAHYIEGASRPSTPRARRNAHKVDVALVQSIRRQEADEKPNELALLFCHKAGAPKCWSQRRGTSAALSRAPVSFTPGCVHQVCRAPAMTG